MKRQTGKLGHAFALLVAVAAVWSCSSSGGGISGTSLVIGPIDEFGSIVVNGIEFDTDNAEVFLEGDPATLADLQLGMVVFVQGAVKKNGLRGRADIVAADHVLLGPVEAVNALDGTFVSLSQLVITDADTVFASTTIDTLAPGDNVEIFGFFDGDGSIRATRVERFDDIEEIELTGTISNLDTIAETFSLNLLTVDFSMAEIEDAPPGGLEDGMLVEVETEEAPINDLMLAAGVEVRDSDLPVDVGDGVEIAGFISELVSADEFVLNGAQTVFVTPDTVFEDGDASDLVLNARVEVEGVFEIDGSLTAEEIEFEGPSP
jgi:hypothetical protein